MPSLYNFGLLCYVPNTKPVVRVTRLRVELEGHMRFLNPKFEFLMKFINRFFTDSNQKFWFISFAAAMIKA